MEEYETFIAYIKSQIMGEFKEKLDTLIAEQLPREKYNSNKQMWNVNVELGIKVNKFFMATELLGIVTFKPIHLSTPRKQET